MAQTHYQTLQIHEDASSEVIKLAYERLLIDAKEKLQDSPAYFKKEKKLKDAFQLLSNPALRKAYDSKLAEERSVNDKHPTSVSYDNSTSPGFFGGLIFSKGFIISLVLVALYFFGIRMNSNRVMEQHLIYQENIYEQQKKLSSVAAEQAMQNIQSSRLRNDEFYQKQKEKRTERWRLQEKQRLERIARQERSRIKQLERQAKYEEQRKAIAAEKRLEREREQQRLEEYEAKLRLRDTLRQIDRTSKLERMNNTIKSNQ